MLRRAREGRAVQGREAQPQGVRGGAGAVLPPLPPERGGDPDARMAGGTEPHRVRAEHHGPDPARPRGGRGRGGDGHGRDPDRRPAVGPALPRVSATEAGPRVRGLPRERRDQRRDVRGGNPEPAAEGRGPRGARPGVRRRGGAVDRRSPAQRTYRTPRSSTGTVMTEIIETPLGRVAVDAADGLVKEIHLGSRGTT